MSLVDDVRLEVSRTINTLRRRHGNTTDAAEKKEIERTIKALNRKLSVLNKAALLRAADVVADATLEVERAVGAARTGPFDGYLGALEEHLRNFYHLSGLMHGRDALSEAPVSEAPPRLVRSVAPPARGLSPPINSKDFAQLKSEYREYYAACSVRAESRGNVAYCLKRLHQGQAKYEQVGRDLGIPWVFIGVIHAMECGFDFGKHLHNGDPLSARTCMVPPGRPVAGTPPFTWQQSADDALRFKGYHQVTDWSIPHMLYLQEKYNGFGYRRYGVPTPYLWSFSNIYAKGKFVADGRFDPRAVSKQCGAALMFKAVLGE